MEHHFGVATKAIIKNPEGEYLVLFKSAIEDINPNEIDLPGGRLEFGEELEDGLKREIKEEVNLTINVEHPLRTWSLLKEDLHLVGITFLATYVEGEIKLSAEHNSYRWVTKEDILEGDYPKWIKKEFSNL